MRPMDFSSTAIAVARLTRSLKSVIGLDGQQGEKTVTRKATEKIVLRYPLIPDDADVEGLGLPIKGKLVKLLSFADFFINFILVELPIGTGDEDRIVDELVEAFSEVKAGNEREIREVAHATLLATMLLVKSDPVAQRSLNPYVFLQVRRFYGCIAGAPTERRELKEAGSSDDRQDDSGEESDLEHAPNANESAGDPVRQTA